MSGFAKGYWHTGVTVSDLDAATAFFRDVLGYQASEPVTLAEATSRTITGIPDAGLRAVFCTAGDVTIELLHYASSDGTTTPPIPDRFGHAHLAIKVRDLDGLLARCADYGRVPMGGIVSIAQGPRAGWRVCYTVDRDGLVIEFAETPD